MGHIVYWKEGVGAMGEVWGIFMARRSLTKMEICYQGGKKERQRGDDYDLEVEFWRKGISNQYQKLSYGWECGSVVRRRLGS